VHPSPTVAGGTKFICALFWITCAAPNPSEVAEIQTRNNDDWGVVRLVDQQSLYSCGNGKYWRILPIFNILESSFEVMLVNAQHIKAVPGRKLMSKMLNGLLNYCNMDLCAQVLFPN